MFKDKYSSKYILFYLIIIYVFAFMFWWSFLLFSKTKQHYSDVTKLRSLEYEMNTTQDKSNYFNTQDYQNLSAEFNRKKIMIFTEGAVFFIILFFGMIKIYNSFQQEIRLAKQQKNFLLSITHELKSPLASIKLMNETIKNRTIAKEKQHELLDASLYEVNRLESLIENILLAAKIDNDSYGFNKEKQDLSSICYQVLSSYNHRKDLNLDVNIEDGIQIQGDVVALNSIISNLIDNAIKYGESNNISIKLNKHNKLISLQVADKGKGIPEDEKELIFEKFYRVGSEETRSSKGTGLGLYIVKQLVNYHNGKIKVENNHPTGSVFIIEFDTTKA